MTYPIFVERYKGKQSLRLVCEKCGATRDCGPDEIDQEDLYNCHACDGDAVFMYVEADKCPNCQKLGFYDDVLDRCCSRVCQLQAEYARSLNPRPHGSVSPKHGGGKDA